MITLPPPNYFSVSNPKGMLLMSDEKMFEAVDCPPNLYYAVGVAPTQLQNVRFARADCDDAFRRMNEVVQEFAIPPGGAKFVVVRYSRPPVNEKLANDIALTALRDAVGTLDSAANGRGRVGSLPKPMLVNLLHAVKEILTDALSSIPVEGGEGGQ